MSNAQRLAHDPEKIRMETICLDGRLIFMRRDMAALDKNLLAERNPDRISSDRRIAVFLRVPTLDCSDYRRLVGR